MSLSAPTTVVFIISVIIAIIGLLAFLAVIPGLPIPSFWIMTIAWVVLAAGCMFKGM